MALPCILGSVSCRGPELRVRSSVNLDLPFILMVRLPEGPDREAREAILQDDLKAALGSRLALVREEDRKERDPILWVVVQEASRGEVVKRAVSGSVAKGASTGTALGLGTGVGTASVLGDGSQNNKAAKDNLAFIAVTTTAGAVVGTAVGTVGGISDGVVRGAYHDLRLGYRPKHLTCRISYAPDGVTSPWEIGSTDAWAVVKEMRPMSREDAHDIQKLHQEEARALAVVVDRILKKASAWK